MSSKEHFQKIAQVLKSDGADGGLVIGFREVGPEDIDISEPVFIYFDGLPVPFFFESFKRRGQNKAVVQLTGIRNFDDAEEIAGKSIYVDPEQHGLEFDGPDGELLLDWTVADAEGQPIGSVAAFHDFGGNACLEVARPGNDSILVPFHEDLIISIDENHQIISMTIPQGLADM